MMGRSANRIVFLVLGTFLGLVGLYAISRATGLWGDTGDPLMTASQQRSVTGNADEYAVAGALIAGLIAALAWAWAAAQRSRAHMAGRVPVRVLDDVDATAPPAALAARLEDDLRLAERDSEPDVHVDGVEPLYLVAEVRASEDELPPLVDATRRFVEELRPVFGDTVVELNADLLPPRRRRRARGEGAPQPV